MANDMAAAAAAAATAAEAAGGGGGKNSTVTKRATFTLAMHPSAVTDAHAGARELLDSMLMRHHDQLGGVLMAYSDEKIVGTSSRIIHMVVVVAGRPRVFAVDPALAFRNLQGPPG